MSDWAQWEPWAVGGVIAVLVAGFIARALFSDRARGRPRCHRCGYDFEGVEGLTCPECGWTARTPADLLRTRRHWFKAIVGVTLLVLAAGLIRLHAAGGNPLLVVPDRLMIALLPIDPTAGGTEIGPIADELRRRLMAEELDESEVESLFARIASGDDGAPPGSEAWRARYGGLVDAWRSRFVRPGDPEAKVLLSIPPRLEVEVPASWPITRAVPAELDFEDWWPIGTEAMVELRWQGDDAITEPPLVRIGFRNRASVGRPHGFELPPANTWPEPAILEATVRPRFVDSERLRLAEDGIDVPEDVEAITELVPPPPFDSMPPTIAITEAARPLDLPLPSITAWTGDEVVEDAVRRIFAPGLRRWDGTRRPFAIRFDVQQAAEKLFKDVLFGLVVELVEVAPDGAESVHRRSRIWLPGGPGPNGYWRSRWGISEEDGDALHRAFDPTPGSRWFMRIRGDEELARLALASVVNQGGDPATFTRWWSGTVNRPLRTTEESRRPFIRRWFHPDGVRRPDAP